MTQDQLLFGAFPYVALALAIIVTTLRFTSRKFSYSSLSSQFLEKKKLFWGSVSWHYGLFVLLAGHLVAFLIPRSILAWNGTPWRLYVLEGSALVCGLLVVWGMIALIYRRISSAKIRVVTSKMDVILLLVLLIQVVAGVYIAIYYRWGSSWFASSMTPYLWSILSFSPDLSFINTMPFAVKLHIFGAWLLVALLPFTRLVHFLSFPFSYFRRPNQVVVWYRKKY